MTGPRVTRERRCSAAHLKTFDEVARKSGTVNSLFVLRFRGCSGRHSLWTLRARVTRALPFVAPSSFCLRSWRVNHFRFWLSAGFVRTLTLIVSLLPHLPSPFLAAQVLVLVS